MRPASSYFHQCRSLNSPHLVSSPPRARLFMIYEQKLRQKQKQATPQKQLRQECIMLTNSSLNGLLTGELQVVSNRQL